MRIRIRILVRLESSKKWNSTSVLLNKLATSQEVSDLLVLEEIPLLLWFFFVRIRIRMNPDPIQIRIRKSEIQPQSCWTSLRRRRKSMTSLFSRSSRFFCGLFLSSWIRIRIRMNPDSKQWIQPQSCWTSLRRRRNSMTSLFSRSSRFFSLRISSRMEVFTKSGPIRIISSGRGGGGAASKLKTKKRPWWLKGTVSRDGIGLWGGTCMVSSK